MKLNFIVFICILIGCSEKPNPEQQAEGAAITSDTIFVASYKSRLEPLSYPVKAIGKIRSRQRSKLIFERSGIIQIINVANGQKVRKDQVIATLKNTDEKYRLESAQIALKKALVNYESEMLALRDSLYYQEKWAKVKENVQLNTGVQSAKVNVAQAKLAYEQTIIKAPLSGIIEGVVLQAGDFVSSNNALGSIYDPSSFEVTCDVLEYDILKVKKGMAAMIELLASEGQIVEGIISEINPAVNSQGLTSVIIRLNEAKNIIPGLSARVEINITDEPSIVIPMLAVVNRSERHVVFNVEDGKAKWNYVTLGKNNGEQVQILEGLTEGMDIIVSNNLQLAHDSPVRLE